MIALSRGTVPLLALSACALLVPASVRAAPAPSSRAAAPADESGKTTLNFVNADIPEVIRAISHITKRNFLVDPRVKGTINIVSATAVSSDAAYNLLLSALRMQGYAAVDSGGVTRILPEADAKLYIGEVSSRNTRKDEIVTHIFPLQYESANQVVNVVRPLISPNNVVVAYPNTNTLVVTDYASNLRRIEQIVHSLDQPTTETPVIIPVLHVSAADLAQTINRLMQDPTTGSDTTNRFVLLADVRSNSLLLRSANPERIARVEDLVKKLDVETHTPGNIHVIYLKNAEAKALAETLHGVMMGAVPSVPGSPMTAQNSMGQNPGTDAMIQADPSSNSLIIVAPDAVYNNLRNVVDMLDVRRAQVFVEALITEVSADKIAQFGIQWQALSNASGASNQSKVFGGTNFGAHAAGGNILDASANLSTVNQGLNVGVVRGQVTIPGVGTLLNLGALANALEADADANILSTPDLLTLDNEEAKIVIGQNVPFITGQYAQTGNATTATPFQTIERKDVGLTLRIKPQISEGGTVKLKIYQEVSSVDPASLTNAAGLITNKRSLESSVLVDEGQIVVLGGLIQDQVTTSESRVPLLGSIPIIGALFRYQTRQHNKTNLMIFIRPHVLHDQQSAVSLSQSRYNYMRTQQANSQPGWDLILPSMTAPQLPPADFSTPASAPATTAPQPAPRSDAGTKPVGRGTAGAPLTSSSEAAASAVAATR